MSSILLTGPPGVGKTTVIRKIISALQEKQQKCTGFYTEEKRSENGERIGFDVVTVDGNRGILARQSPGDKIKRPQIGKYSVYIKDFEDMVLPLLKTESQTILFIDEIGKMELLSKKFKHRIEEIFGKTFIIATVPSRATIDVVERLKADKSSAVIEITKKNRNEIVSQIIEKASQMVSFLK